MVVRSRRYGKVDQQKRRDANLWLDVPADPVPNSHQPGGFDAGNRLLTVAQAAQICQISERQMRRMIRDGRIPA